MRILSLFFCVVSIATAATITVSTTCTSSSQSVIGGPSCGLGDGVGYGRAQASGAFSLTGNAATFDSATNAIAVPGQPPPGQFYQPFSGAASVTITANLFTTGPVRQGYVLISGQSQTGNGGVGGGNVNYSIGPFLNMGCSVFQVCSLGLGTDLVKIQLGTDLAITELTTAFGETDPFEAQGDGLANTAETLKFFEADGLTPVSVFDTDAVVVPEPSVLGLLILSFAGLVKRTRCS